MTEASSMDAPGAGERTLFGRVPPGPARASGLRRSAHRIGRRDGRRRAEGVVNIAGGNRGGGRSRVGRGIVGEADDIGTSNNESIEIIVVDVRPLESVIHSGEAGEIARGWLISASILHVDLTMGESPLSHRMECELKAGYIHAARVVLGVVDGMKGNDLIANQLWARKKRQFRQVEVLMQQD